LRRIVKSPQADADLQDIWLHSAQRFGLAQADSFILAIHRRFELLAERPHLGIARPGISAGLHVYCRPAPMVIAYRFTTDELRVVRVFHGRRSYEALLRD
jgi:toxin ParE1/3/4